MTYRADLETARDQILARITEVTLAAKPSYQVDGQAVSWTAYLKELRFQLKALEDAILRADGPFEHQTQGFT